MSLAYAIQDYNQGSMATSIVVSVSCILTSYFLLLPLALADTQLDVQSLLAFKTRITHDPFEVLQNWHQNSPNACNWTGVSCSSKHPGRVIRLQLFNSSLGGVIAPEIGNLSFLHSLDLSTNNFTGGIPPSIGGLYRLKLLDVSDNNHLGGVIPSELSHLYNLRKFIAFYNDFVGTIPLSLANCSQLQVLSLGRNKLSGSIPDTFGSLAHLAAVNIPENTLVGYIPASLFNCSKLQHLSVYSNRLTGSIPHNIGSLPNLNILILSVNSFTGTIPKSIDNITTLIKLEFSQNHFHGALPAFLGSVSGLEGLYVWENRFTGTISRSWCNATGLTRLNLHANRLHGTVPLCLAALPNLQELEIGDNNFVSGLTNINRPIPILEAFSNSSKLSILYLNSNNFQGTLSITLPTSLTTFYIDSNFVTGKIPVAIGNLSSLITLDLGYNFLEGGIPTQIGLMQSLQYLSISENLLEGSIPKQISLLNSSLNYMYLDSNKFIGSIPASLKDLISLRELDLSMNSFSGPIPKQLGKCSNLEYLDLSSNHLSGEIPSEVSNLRNIQTTFNLSHNILSGTVRGLELPMAENIDLSHNQLSGEITMSMAGWVNAMIIDLSFNSFRGMLPESLGAKLSMLQIIDLSANNFTGSIPQSMYNLSGLRFLNFSFNNFEGNVSCSGAFRILSRRSFLHNPLLCGKCFNLTECMSKTKRSSTSNKKHIILIVSLVIVAVICVICFAIFSFLFSKKLKTNSRESLLEMNPFMNISEAEVVQATHNFSPNCLLGQGNHGSVYGGVLKGGDPVAIKVFSETQHRSGFLKECQTLGRVRHKNLMKIITVYCTENLKAMVMPLMPKGNLHNLLHEKDAYGQLSTLSLQTRARLLQELAAGLSYLHHYCTPQIVHCDVKPENVLLDYDFSVKLSDFGIAKLLGNSNTTEASTLRGSIGYIAPEFGAGEVSVKGDIYSFGVVLLEVITRVKPTDAMFVDNLNLCNWVATALQGRQLESVLNVNSGLEITEEDEWIIVEKILRTGVSACSYFVDERPEMDKIEGMLALLCDAKKDERVGPGNLDAILASSFQPIQQVPESEHSSTFE